MAERERGDFNGGVDEVLKIGVAATVAPEGDWVAGLEGRGLIVLCYVDSWFGRHNEMI